MKKLLPILFALFVSLPAIGQPTSYDRPIHDAARTGTGAEVSKLLKADPKQRDVRTELGSTPLHMAAYGSRAVHTQLLLEAGADPLAKTDNGRDAGSMARKVKADETAGILSLWILKGCKAGKPC